MGWSLSEVTLTSGQGQGRAARGGGGGGGGAGGAVDVKLLHGQLRFNSLHLISHPGRFDQQPLVEANI